MRIGKDGVGAAAVEVRIGECVDHGIGLHTGQESTVTLAASMLMSAGPMILYSLFHRLLSFGLSEGSVKG